jgi:hypothetical protein
MKPFVIIIITSLTLFSCSQKQQNTRPDIDYLSKWFNENEDSLYQEFIRNVKSSSLCSTCDTSWGEVAYQRVDSISYMGRFSLQAKKYCDSIEITYFYNRNGSTPTARILLSTDYNRRFTSALDTVLNSINPKHFTVEKYEQPNLTADMLSSDNMNVVVKELRIDMKPHDTLQDVTVFIHGNPKNKVMTSDFKDFLRQQLFGEELLLKKINHVDFKFADSIDNNLLSLEDARLKFK